MPKTIVLYDPITDQIKGTIILAKDEDVFLYPDAVEMPNDHPLLHSRGANPEPPHIRQEKLKQEIKRRRMNGPPPQLG